MKRFFSFLATLLVVALVVLTTGGLWAYYQITKPAAFDGMKDIVIEPGTHGMALAGRLQAEGVITQPELFYALRRLHPAIIKAGEYEFPAHASLKNVVAIIESGKLIQRQVTLAEGLTVKQAMILLHNNPYLTGDIATTPVEGSLLPETYIFTRGDTRQSIVDKMQAAQKKILAQLWAQRDPAIMLLSPEQAVTLASIVEKETGKADERPRIASLFYNRIKLGMMLQSDPTVVYVITDHLGSMAGKPLYGSALQVASPYNTYKVTGLPPGPIANPGKASLQAVLHPEQNDYLYFVANGTGGHVFARDLATHNENVARWREIKKERNAPSSSP